MTRFDRQSFLGADSEQRLAALTLGIVGLGGGGSHVVQQLAHIGVGGMVCVDDDIVECSNLNRLIGATLEDADAKLLKARVAERMVLGLVAKPRLKVIPRKWQDATEALSECDIIVGGVDSYRERDELEGFCRRLLIPYVDMGMDVHELDAGFSIGGQVILSSPGKPCLRCLGLLTDERLKLEAQDYGAAGGKPQVVWPNGVLASVAVGLVVQLVTPWLRHPVATAYLEYDGNRHQVMTSNRLRAVMDEACSHYPADQTGDPFFDIRRPVAVEPLSGPATGEPSPLGFWRRLFARLRRSRP
jgi:molybdopterin-synthase adenylyltransferase